MRIKEVININIIKTGSAFNENFEFYNYDNGKVIKSITPDKKIHISIIGEGHVPTDKEISNIIQHFSNNDSKQFTSRRSIKDSYAIIFHEK